jgi:hypothetical protein
VLPWPKEISLLDYKSETPFDSIESAHEYLGLLVKAVEEAKQSAEADAAELGNNSSRRLDAIRLAIYKLEKLEQHVKSGRRLLNDLRTLRRLLLEERAQPAGAPDSHG